MYSFEQNSNTKGPQCIKGASSSFIHNSTENDDTASFFKHYHHLRVASLLLFVSFVLKVIFHLALGRNCAMSHIQVRSVGRRVAGMTWATPTFGRSKPKITVDHPNFWRKEALNGPNQLLNSTYGPVKATNRLATINCSDHRTFFFGGVYGFISKQHGIQSQKKQLIIIWATCF